MKSIRLALLAIALLPAPVLAGANRDRGRTRSGPARTHFSRIDPGLSRLAGGSTA